MSRGLTLEGLHTSYFIRHARTFDTLMQMGRWFGYRSNYADVCRIITTTEIAVDFREICYADTIMNENISAMIRSNASPRDFLIKIRQSTTSLSVTSKMGVAGPMQVSWAGGEVISNLISRDTKTIVHNHNILTELIQNIRDKCNIEEHENRLIFRDVLIEGELDILKNDNFSLVNNNGKLNLTKIFEFYKLSGFETLDVVIVGRQAALESNYTFINKKIGLAQRNSKKPEDSSNFQVPNGKLTDSTYLASFIDSESLKLSKEDQRRPVISCSHLEKTYINFCCDGSMLLLQ